MEMDLHAKEMSKVPGIIVVDGSKHTVRNKC